MKNFARHPGRLHFTGIRAGGLRSLASASGGLLAADISLGAWRSHQIASELCAQLGLPDGAAGPAEARADRAGVPRSKIGRLIDTETRGDRITLDALRLAALVHEAMRDREPMTLCILLGRHGIPWERGDALFVRFLAQAWSSPAHRLVLVSCGVEDPVLPLDWSVTWSSEAPDSAPATPREGSPASSLVPGIITPRIAEALGSVDGGLGALIKLPGDCLLVPPELRGDPRAIAEERYDQLAVTARSIPWLAAHASYRGSDHAVNPSLLWEHACRELEVGGTGIALRLLERATPLARSLAERSVFQLLIQGAQVASGRFEDAANALDPEARAPAELRGWLWHTKGWALTMRSRPVEAEVCLEQARELVQKTGDLEEYLYVMNISALNRLRSGDWEGALAFEEQIRSALAGVSTGGWQLRYINSMNLARLHRRRDDYDAAERDYRGAFATSAGVPSDSDALYLQVCLARLDEARGLHAGALRAWIRAALRWASSAEPEATARRVTAAILGSAVEKGNGDPCDAVSEALTSHLAAAAAGIEASEDLAASSGDAVVIARAGGISPEILASRGWHALRGPGFWVLGTTREVEPIISSTASLRLRSALTALLVPATPGRVALRTIVVDDQLGRDLPGSEAEMITACLRLGLPAVELDGRVIELDDGLRERLEGRLRVRLGDAVERLDLEPSGAVVSFKRYRDPRRLTGLAAGILGLVAGGAASLQDVRAALGAGAVASVVPTLRGLEQDRVVTMSLPDVVTFASLGQIT